MRSCSSHSGLYSFFPLVATLSFWYNIMIKVHQHALINLVYSYMVTKVFNIQPVLFHQYYLCHLLWFKKQSFTLVWKPNPPVCWAYSGCVHLRARADAVSVGSTHKALALKLHLFTWSVKSDSCYNVLWLCSVQTQTCTSATTSIFFTGGGLGGVVRLTAKPRYLLLLHRGKEKSNTVTALVSTWLQYTTRHHIWSWCFGGQFFSGWISPDDTPRPVPAPPCVVVLSEFLLCRYDYQSMQRTDSRCQEV